MPLDNYSVKQTFYTDKINPNIISPYGNRIDNTPKGLVGWLGNIPTQDNSIANELSMTFGDSLFPLLNPYNKQYANYLADGGQPTEEMIENTKRWGNERLQQGLSPFIQPYDIQGLANYNEILRGK